MKYIIYEVEQRGEMRIALDAKPDDYAPKKDELEIDGTEVARHVHSEYLPEKPKRVTAFGRMDQSYRDLYVLLVRGGVKEY